MKLRFVLSILLALVNAACQSTGQPKSAYGEAVSGLTKKRAGSLTNVGWSIQNVNPQVGSVKAKKFRPFTIPRADSSVLRNDPIFLKTGDCLLKDGVLISSVTGYWTGQQ